MDLLDKVDDWVLLNLHDVTTKNILLIGLGLYSVFMVKKLPKNVLDATNNIFVRMALIITIIYISRKHIDLGIMMGLAFYFTIRQASKIRMDHTIEKRMSVDKKDDSKEKPRTTTKAPEPELPNQESQVEHGMRIPFHQSKYVEDLTQPAHQLQQNQENFQDQQSFNMPRQDAATCPMMGVKNESCIQGLTNIQGNIPSGYTDLNNLANF